MRRWAAWGAIGMVIGAGCRAIPPAGPVAGPFPVGCQSVDSVAGRWRATIFIDGARIGDHLIARRESSEPDGFALIDAEPAGLAALRPEAIDLLQFSRGGEAETQLSLCPGYVAFLVSTKSGR